MARAKSQPLPVVAKEAHPLAPASRTVTVRAQEALESA
jgi:hypothetical protein